MGVVGAIVLLLFFIGLLSNVASWVAAALVSGSARRLKGLGRAPFLRGARWVLLALLVFHWVGATVGSIRRYADVRQVPDAPADQRAALLSGFIAEELNHNAYQILLGTPLSAVLLIICIAIYRRGKTE